MANLGFKEDFNSSYYKFTTVMVFLNCTIIPFIYLFKYQDFQRALLKSVVCMKLKEVRSSESDTTVSTSM